MRPYVQSFDAEPKRRRSPPHQRSPNVQLERHTAVSMAASVFRVRLERGPNIHVQQFGFARTTRLLQSYVHLSSRFRRRLVVRRIRQSSSIGKEQDVHRSVRVATVDSKQDQVGGLIRESLRRSEWTRSIRYRNEEIRAHRYLRLLRKAQVRNKVSRLGRMGDRLAQRPPMSSAFDEGLQVLLVAREHDLSRLRY